MRLAVDLGGIRMWPWAGRHGTAEGIRGTEDACVLPNLRHLKEKKGGGQGDLRSLQVSPSVVEAQIATVLCFTLFGSIQGILRRF